MKRLAISDILERESYEKLRPAYRAKIVELKTRRTIAAGPEVKFVFENRETMHFQVQEMVRTERLCDDEQIQDEIDVYNRLIPGDFELSATLMIEIAEVGNIRETLERLVGIDEHVFIDVGAKAIQATFIAKQFPDDRISAVQHVRFQLEAELAEQFCDLSVLAKLRIEHPNYRACVALAGPVRGALVGDLRQELQHPAD